MMLMIIKIKIMLLFFQNHIEKITDVTVAQELLKMWANNSPRQANSFILGQQEMHERPISGPSPSYCICGLCIIMEKAEMNFCCGQNPCLSTTSTFSDLTKESVIEIAGITNYCDGFHQVADYTSPRLYRNQAYRFLILWNCDKLGKGKRVCPPSCCVARIRFLYPFPDNQYTGYESFSDVDDN